MAQKARPFLHDVLKLVTLTGRYWLVMSLHHCSSDWLEFTRSWQASEEKEGEREGWRESVWVQCRKLSDVSLYLACIQRPLVGFFPFRNVTIGNSSDLFCLLHSSDLLTNRADRTVFYCRLVFMFPMFWLK